MITSTIENTAGVVVLYHPEEDVMANITSYLPNIAVLYCIDNSEATDTALVAQLTSSTKIHYLKNEGNSGLAAALNQGAALALEHGYQWLLTMDQDSKAHQDMLSILRDCLVQCKEEKVGIMAPFQLDKDNQQIALKDGVQPMETVMTSGNLLSLEAFSHVGPFRTEFFIDYLDHEFCLRLRVHGYKILQAQKAILYHSVGEITLNHMLGMRITASNHSPVRRYYITRNRLQVVSMYKSYFPEYVKQDTLAMLKDVARIIFFEKEKLKKLLYMGYGIRDFRKSSFGRFLE